MDPGKHTRSSFISYRKHTIIAHIRIYNPAFECTQCRPAKMTHLSFCILHLQIHNRRNLKKLGIYYNCRKQDAWNIHEITIIMIFYHTSKQWRLSFLIISKKKVPPCSPKYPMNDTTCSSFKSRHPKKKWYLQEADQ